MTVYDVEHWNLDAELFPADDTDEAPAINLAGITVLTFLDGEQDTPQLAIQIILDDLDPQLREMLGGELEVNVEVMGRECASGTRVQLRPYTP